MYPNASFDHGKRVKNCIDAPTSNKVCDSLFFESRQHLVLGLKQLPFISANMNFVSRLQVMIYRIVISKVTKYVTSHESLRILTRQDACKYARTVS